MIDPRQVYVISVCMFDCGFRFRSDRMKDRLVSYILVLALIIDDFHLVPLDLQADLKLGRIK